MGSFLARPWPKALKSALGKRIDVIPEGYQAWTHGRQPFIRVTSNVKINGNTQYRKQFQLFSGNLKGLTTSYDLNNRNEPRPGITSLSVKDTGSTGALRKINYEFKCWSLEQLKAMEALYMSLGTFQCVEWGWTTKQDGSRVFQKMPLDSPGALGSMSDFYKKVRELSKSAEFCYDAAKGKVSNFSWTLNEVGGFDCSVELTSMGNIMLETPTQTASVSNGCSDADDEEDVDQKQPNVKTICSFLYETMEKGEAFTVEGHGGGEVFAGTAIVFDKDISDEDKEKDNDEQSFNDEISYYVTWDFFEERMINKLLIPKINPNSGKTESDLDPAAQNDISQNERTWTKIWNNFKSQSQAKFLVKRENNGIGALDSRGLTIPNVNPYLISSNPNVCLLPGQEHYTGFEDGSPAIQAWFEGAAVGLGVATAGAAATGVGAPVAIVTGGLALISAGVAWLLDDDNVNESSLKGLKEAKAGGLNFAVDGNPMKGFLGSMLLNVRHLEQSLDDSKTVAEYIQKILDDISEACSNQFDLSVVEDPDNPSILRIVDSGTIDDDSEDKDRVVVFPVMGPRSIARSVNLETKLSGNIAAQVMYGTNRKVNSHEMGEDNTSDFGFWNARVVDMDYENIKMVESLKKDEECCKDDQNGPTDQEATIKGIVESYKDSRVELAENVGAESIEAANTATRKMIETQTEFSVDGADGGEKIRVSARSIGATLPLSLGLTIDGISGIKWGLPMTIDYLPPRYSGVYFTVVGVDHTIDSTGWTTALNTVMRGGGGNIGATGFPTPPPTEEEAPPIVRETPPPPPPPEEQPIVEEEEEVVEPEPEVEEEPVESRHIDQDEAGTEGMIVYSGKWIYGEMGGGLFAKEEAISRADRTYTWRLIQRKNNNTYRVEVDGVQITNIGTKRKPKFKIGEMGIYGFSRVARSNQFGMGNQIGTTANYGEHDEKDLQELIDLCEDNTQSDHAARIIWGAIRDHIAIRFNLFKNLRDVSAQWTAPGEKVYGGRFG